MPTLSGKWVVVLETEPCVIGPFKTAEDAAAYRDSDYESANMRVMQIYCAARGWRNSSTPRRKVATTS